MDVNTTVEPRRREGSPLRGAPYGAQAPMALGFDGLEIASACTVADLTGLALPGIWAATQHLIARCCRSFPAPSTSWNVTTVGGNLRNSLPSGPMIALTAALEGECALRTPEGVERRLRVVDFVTGVGRNALAEGELLRSVTLPAGALCSPTAFRRVCPHPRARSSALLIGRFDPADGSFTLTITASTVRPVQVRFAQPPDADALRRSVEAAVSKDEWYDDPGSGVPVPADSRRDLTLRLAEEIRRELHDRNAQGTHRPGAGKVR